MYVIKMYVHTASVSYKDENTISAFNNTLEGLKRRLNTADDKTDYLENWSMEITKTVSNKETKQNEKAEESIKKYVESVQHVLFVELQGGREQSRGIFEEMVTESLPTV